MGRVVEKKWLFFLDREERLWRRTTTGWVVLQGNGAESAENLKGP